MPRGQQSTGLSILSPESKRNWAASSRIGKKNKITNHITISQDVNTEGSFYVPGIPAEQKTLSTQLWTSERMNEWPLQRAMPACKVFVLESQRKLCISGGQVWAHLLLQIILECGNVSRILLAYYGHPFHWTWSLMLKWIARSHRGLARRNVMPDEWCQPRAQQCKRLLFVLSSLYLELSFWMSWNSKIHFASVGCGADFWWSCRGWLTQPQAPACLNVLSESWHLGSQRK